MHQTSSGFSPTPHKLDVEMHACNLSTQEVEARDQKFKIIFKYNVILNYIAKLAWAM